MVVLGLDIGGANIKAATTEQLACSKPFPLWKHPARLTDFLTSDVLPQFSHFDLVALTMTGELCDCFANKSEGVRQILKSVRQALPESKIAVYSVDGVFCVPTEVDDQPLKFAASNWHATANYSRRWLDESTPNGLLIDLGSTSCDLIPISRDAVIAKGTTDLTRMINHELVYTGAGRTPVCAVINQIEFRGETLPIAQEMFATMQDVYLLLGSIAEQPDNLDTADGCPLTRSDSLRRLSRMLCSDPGELLETDLHAMAEQVRRAQLELIERAWQQVSQPFDSSTLRVIHAGSGSFLISDLLSKTNCQVVSLSKKLGSEMSGVAPAYAVAVLLSESLSEMNEDI